MHGFWLQQTVAPRGSLQLSLSLYQYVRDTFGGILKIGLDNVGKTF